MKKTVCLVLSVLLVLFAITIPVYAADGGTRGGGDTHRGGGDSRGGDTHRGGGTYRGGDTHRGGTYRGGRTYRGGDTRGRWGGRRGGDGHHGDWDFWIGPGWGGWGPWWWGSPYYPYYPYPAYNPYYPNGSVVIEQPPAYGQAPAYIQPPQPDEQTYYWYFCQESQGYYPYIKQCPGGWLKVVPPKTPPDERE